MFTTKESLTIMEAALILGVKVSYIKKLSEQGYLSYTISDKGLKVFKMDDITRFVNDQEIDSDISPLFPMDNETESNICYHIVKGDFAQLVNYSYLQCLLFNRLRLFQVLKGLVSLKRSLYEIYDELVVPILDRNREFYEQGKVTLMEMRSVKSVILDSIIRLQGLMVLNDDYIASVYCVGVTKDCNDPLLKMLDHVLELKGFRVINCGTLNENLAIEKMFDDFCCPQRIYIVMPSESDDEETYEIVQNLFNVLLKYKTDIYLFGKNIESYKELIPNFATRLSTFADIANT